MMFWIELSFYHFNVVLFTYQGIGVNFVFYASYGLRVIITTGRVLAPVSFCFPLLGVFFLYLWCCRCFCCFTLSLSFFLFVIFYFLLFISFFFTLVSVAKKLIDLNAWLWLWFFLLSHSPPPLVPFSSFYVLLKVWAFPFFHFPNFPLLFKVVFNGLLEVAKYFVLVVRSWNIHPQRFPRPTEILNCPIITCTSSSLFSFITMVSMNAIDLPSSSSFFFGPPQPHSPHSQR